MNYTGSEATQTTRMVIRAEQSALQTALGKLERCREALTDLSYLWAESHPQALWWDDVFRTFVTIGHRNIYPAIFGSHPRVRSLVAHQSLGPLARDMARSCHRQRWHGPFDLGFPLPPSTIVIPPIASKQGIVCASADTGTVMKLNYGRSEVQVEAECWVIAVKAGITNRVPEILDQGSTTDNGHWMFSRLAPNSSPLHRPLNPFADSQKQWLHWMRWKILPVMQDFYDCAGVSETNCQHILSQFRGTDSGPRPASLLVRLAELAGESLSHARSELATSSLTHKDLIPGHIHRHNNDWWIMDWGSARRDLIVKEVFRGYFWTPTDKSRVHRAFWQWLRGDLGADQVPELLRFQIASFIDWYTSWQKTGMDAETLRSQLLFALLLDCNEVVTKFSLQDRIHDASGSSDLPAWVRTISGKFRALGLAN